MTRPESRLIEQAVLIEREDANAVAFALLQYGRANGGLSPRLTRLHTDLHRLATAYHRLVLDGRGTAEPSPQACCGTAEPSVGVGLDNLSVMDVAKVLNVSPRYVRRCAQQEALIGDRRRDGWQFTPDDVAAFVAQRSAQ